ncbi:MAG TPA: cupin domain-containing protein [Thermoleophilaceae bacterium]|jgi:50S ribosomal protein L16 3-hydroxylase
MSVSAEFLAARWQTAPEALPGLAADWLDRDWVARFESWAVPPTTARLFVLQEDGPAGAATAATMPDPRVAYELFQRYAGEGQQLTLLLNHTERVAPELRELRDGLGIGNPWRHDDVVATLSTAGSGIGYHAGHEDSLVVQLAGRRHWRAWSADHVPASHRHELVWRHAPEGPGAIRRPAADPLVDCELGPGDVLYVPSLFPHEGRTLELSVSLSIAWRGVSVATLLDEVEALPAAERTLTERHPDAFLRLVRDPPPGAPDACAAVMEQLDPALRALRVSATEREWVRRSVDELLAG